MVEEFNSEFIIIMRKVPKYLKPNNSICHVLYCGSFNSNIGYSLRDKKPQIINEAYATSINIKSNMRASSNNLKRIDANLSQLDKVSINKLLKTKNKLDKLMWFIKYLSY